MRGSRGFSTMPLVVKNLIIINALFFLARYTFISIASTDLNDTLGLYYFKSPEFNPWQLVSYLFMHGGMSHLFFNMFALWMFGSQMKIFGGLNGF